MNLKNYQISFDLYVEAVKKLGYSVLIRHQHDHKVITWSTKDHWASAPYKESSEDDLVHVIEKLNETIVSFSNDR